MEQEGLQGEDNMKTDLLDIRHMDCMDLMKEFPDNHFDLAVVDPPYGLGERLTKQGNTSHLKNRVMSVKDSSWDHSVPLPEYFTELFRVSKNQVIWGGNYFNLNPTRCVLWWDKCQPWENFSSGELAWTSFDKPARQFTLDNRTGGKIHPTQKPVKLYDWIFANYAKEGMKILDTHMGSGSIAISAHYAGMHLTACELDEEYYKMACERIERETRQLSFL